MNPDILLIDGGALYMSLSQNNRVVEMSCPALECRCIFVSSGNSRVGMMHSAIAESLGLHATDIGAVRLLREEPSPPARSARAWV